MPTCDKGDWDVGITIDVLDAAPRVVEVVLLSGDGDFSLLLEKVIRAHGVCFLQVPWPDRQHADPGGVALRADRGRTAGLTGRSGRTMGRIR